MIVHAWIEVSRVGVGDVQELVTHGHRLTATDVDANAWAEIKEKIQPGSVCGIDWNRFGRGDNPAMCCKKRLERMPSKVCRKPNG